MIMILGSFGSIACFTDLQADTKKMELIRQRILNTFILSALIEITHLVGKYGEVQ